MRLAVGIEKGRGKRKRWQFLAGVHPTDGAVLTDDARMAQVFDTFSGAASRVTAAGKGARVVDLDDLTIDAMSIARVAGGAVRLGEPGAPKASKDPRPRPKRIEDERWAVCTNPEDDAAPNVMVESLGRGAYVCKVYEGTDHVPGDPVDATRDKFARLIAAAPDMYRLLLALGDDDEIGLRERQLVRNMLKQIEG
jgi:hypothetical protein